MSNRPECLTCDCTFSSGCRGERLAAERLPAAKVDKHPNRKHGRPRGQGPIQLMRAYKAEQRQKQENP